MRPLHSTAEEERIEELDAIARKMENDIFLAMDSGNVSKLERIFASKHFDPASKLYTRGKGWHGPLEKAALTENPAIVKAVLDNERVKAALAGEVDDQRRVQEVRDGYRLALIYALGIDNVACVYSTDIVKLLLEYRPLGSKEMGIDDIICARLGFHPEALLARLVEQNHGLIELVLPHIDPDYLDGWYRALEIATYMDDVHMVRLLLTCEFKDKKQPQMNSNLDSHFKLVLCAVEKNRIEILKLLLQHPAIDPNIVGSHGRIPLHMAVEQQNVEALQILLQHQKIDPNIEDNLKRTPLHMAVEQQNVKALKILLQHPEINPNVRSSYGSIPLRKAVEQQNVEVIKPLLAHPNIDIKNAFAEAIYSGNYKVVRLFVAKIRNIQEEDLPEYNGSDLPSFEEIQQLVMGIELGEYCEKRELQKVQFFLDPEKVTLEEKEKHRALYIAARYGHHGHIWPLLGNSCDSGLGGLLREAAEYGHLECVKQLLRSLDNNASKGDIIGFVEDNASPPERALVLRIDDTNPGSELCEQLEKIFRIAYPLRTNVGYSITEALEHGHADILKEIGNKFPQAFFRVVTSDPNEMRPAHLVLADHVVDAIKNGHTDVVKLFFDYCVSKANELPEDSQLKKAVSYITERANELPENSKVKKDVNQAVEYVMDMANGMPGTSELKKAAEQAVKYITEKADELPEDSELKTAVTQVANYLKGEAQLPQDYGLKKAVSGAVGHITSKGQLSVFLQKALEHPKYLDTFQFLFIELSKRHAQNDQLLGLLEHAAECGAGPDILKLFFDKFAIFNDKKIEVVHEAFKSAVYHNKGAIRLFLESEDFSLFINQSPECKQEAFQGAVRSCDRDIISFFLEKFGREIITQESHAVIQEAFQGAVRSCDSDTISFFLEEFDEEIVTPVVVAKALLSNSKKRIDPNTFTELCLRADVKTIISSLHNAHTIFNILKHEKEIPQIVNKYKSSLDALGEHTSGTPQDLVGSIGEFAFFGGIKEHHEFLTQLRDFMKEEDRYKVRVLGGQLWRDVQEVCRLFGIEAPESAQGEELENAQNEGAESAQGEGGENTQGKGPKTWDEEWDHHWLNHQAEKVKETADQLAPVANPEHTSPPGESRAETDTDTPSKVDGGDDGSHSDEGRLSGDDDSEIGDEEDFYIPLSGVREPDDGWLSDDDDGGIEEVAESSLTMPVEEVHTEVVHNVDHLIPDITLEPNQGRMPAERIPEVIGTAQHRFNIYSSLLNDLDLTEDARTKMVKIIKEEYNSLKPDAIFNCTEKTPLIWAIELDVSSIVRSQLSSLTLVEMQAILKEVEENESAKLVEKHLNNTRLIAAFGAIALSASVTGAGYLWFGLDLLAASATMQMALTATAIVVLIGVYEVAARTTVASRVANGFESAEQVQVLQ
jgi:hypothetical protein